MLNAGISFWFNLLQLLEIKSLLASPTWYDGNLAPLLAGTFSDRNSQLDSTEKGTLQERKIRVNWLTAKSEDGAEPIPAAVATPNKATAVSGVVCRGFL